MVSVAHQARLAAARSPGRRGPSRNPVPGRSQAPAWRRRLTRLRRTALGRPYLLLFLLLFVLLGGARLWLPVWLTHYVNRQLDRAEGYGGVVHDVDANLWRGAYEIEGLRIDKELAGVGEPLFQAQRFDLSMYWSELVRGSVVGELDVLRPVLQIAAAKDERQAETGKDVAWHERIDALFPFRIERLTIRDGTIHYRDNDAEPPFDLFFTEVWAKAKGLSNRAGAAAEETQARLDVACRPLGSGELVGRLKFDPAARPLRFELDLSIQRVDLRLLNDLLVAWAGFEVERGKMDLFIELAGRDGRVEGYAKVLIEDLSVFEFGELTTPADALDGVWELMVGAAAEVLENQPHNRLATRVEISGTLDDPNARLWPILGSVLQNAFISALAPGFDKRGGGRGELPEDGGVRGDGPPREAR